MWLHFLDNYNGMPYCIKYFTSDQLNLFSDASDWGFAVIFGSHWVQGQCPLNWCSLHINICEFFPLYLVLAIWGAHFAGWVISFSVDNLVVVQVVNKASTQDVFMLRILRAMTLLSLIHDCWLSARHMPSVHNKAADALSRFQATPDLCLALGVLPHPDHTDHSSYLSKILCDDFWGHPFHLQPVDLILLLSVNSIAL